MNRNGLYLVIIFPALLLAACANDMRALLSKDDVRAGAINALVSDPSTREEVVERLLSTPAEREALFGQIMENEEHAGALIQQMMRSDRGKAVMASQFTSDKDVARTMIGMMMLTGEVGEVLTQEQAECLDLGQAFAHGNQRRSMIDLKRLGGVIDGWAHDHDGAVPHCDVYGDVAGCLASQLPEGTLADLRLEDAWGTPFQYHSDRDGKSYVLISYATDGLSDGLGMAGPMSSYDADIVYSNGEFVQWPGHIPVEKIR